MAAILQRSWEGGPLRYVDKSIVGYIGSYVCDLCKKSCIGVHHCGDIWICSKCLPPEKAPGNAGSTLVYAAETAAPAPNPGGFAGKEHNPGVEKKSLQRVLLLRR